MFYPLQVTLGVIFLIGNGYCDSEYSSARYDSFYVKNRIQKISYDMYEILQLLPETVQYKDGGVVAAPFMAVGPLGKYLHFSSGLSRQHLYNYLQLTPSELHDISLRQIEALVPRTFNTAFVAFSKTFVQQGLNLSKAFVEETINEDGYKVDHINFRFPERAAKAINSWAFIESKGVARDLVEPQSIQKGTEVLMINFLYFQGTWMNTFSDNKFPGIFFGDHTPNIRTLWYMSQLDYFDYKRCDELNADIVRMPFTNQDFEFVLINPAEFTQLGFVLNVTRKLQENPEILEIALKKSKRHLMDLSVPEVTISSTIDMKEALKVLGVTDIFDSRLANLEAMFEEGYNGHVSSMMQKVIVKLDSKGVNATDSLTPVTILLLAIADVDGMRVPSSSLLRDASDKFTAKLFSEVANERSNSSFVISAFSVMTPLSLLSIGSNGKTHEELLNTLGFQNDEDIKEAMLTVTSILRSVKGIEMKMANRIYIPVSYKLIDDFVQTSKNVFQTEVKNSDFHNPNKTVAEINGWVESQTNNKIKDLIKETDVNDNTKALLINALYFKGMWDRAFDKSQSESGIFHKSKSETTQVSYMTMENNRFNYAESDELNAKILEIPYAGKEASFLIILPNEVDGLNAVQAKLKDTAVLKKATLRLDESKLDVTIPKFKIETTTNLKKVLEKMGTTRVFSYHAELTKLLKTNAELHVSSATQKVFIDINEDGTEAAAANVLKPVTKSFARPLKSFKADHPFIFMIKMQNIILFSGVYKP